ncbi:MAG: hypothetical protein ACP5OA_06860 [Candidatus Woesearchaeota archaeon]
MYIPKRYGESRVENCPFCSKQAIIKNPQGIPVCLSHKTQKIPEMKCSCGGHLMIQEGKFGAFFNCIKCGNMNLKKVLDMNSERINSKDITVKNNRNTTIRPSTTKITRKKEKSKQRNETIRSDDPRYF